MILIQALCGAFMFGVLCMGPIGAERSTRVVDTKIEPIDWSLRLSDVGASIGIGPLNHAIGMGTGINAADYDNDGDIDLFVPSGVGFACQLYRNDGGVFTDVAVASG